MADMLPARTEPTPVVVTRRVPRRLEPIDFLEGISRLMDSCFEIPGSRVRIGLNTFLLLAPGVGDAIASAISTLILVVGISSYRLPRIVVARLFINVLLDATVSAIPV